MASFINTKKILRWGLLLLVAVLLASCTSMVKTETEVTPPQTETKTEEQIHFASFYEKFRFSAEIPSTWEVMFVPEITSLNIFDPASQESQIFIRFFEAERFLALQTVNILYREMSIKNHVAVRYEIEKKANVSDFPHQPAWRNRKHKLIDIRFTNNNPSLFYVFAYNPELDPELFDRFIDSLVFDNDRKGLQAPLENAKDRITKKPFGIFITKENSPVQPERFTGFHNATDFEALPNEENDISFFAICGGPLRQKKTAPGYGGVLVQECLIEDLAVTVVYGHVNIQSVTKNIGSYLIPGEKLGILGKEKSDETDGERRHLHLGIHKGSGIELRGYVSSQSELQNWLNPEAYF